MKSKFHKLVSATLVTALSLSMVACEEDEIAAGVAGAVIGAAIVHGVNSGHHHRDCNYPTRNVCTSWYDNWGQYHRSCRTVRQSCYRNSPFGSDTGSEFSLMQNKIETTSNSGSFAQQLESNGLTDADFAKEYSMSFESAEEFIQAMDMSRAGNSDGLVQLGLNSKDVQEMAQYRLPTSEGVAALASNLNMKLESTTGMLNRIRAWALTEKVRICAKPEFKMNRDEKKLCNVSN
jgi:hypothetical protein